MTTLGERLRLARERKNLKQTQVKERTGINNKTLSGYENNVSEPDFNTLMVLSDLYEVPINWLFGESEDSSLSLGAKLSRAARLGSKGLNLNLEKYENITPIDTSAMIRIPVMGTIRGGEPIDMIRDYDGFELVEPGLLGGKQGFALKVIGDSMSGDRILEGDIVICVSQEEVHPYEIAVVAIDNQTATLKRVTCHGDVCVLSPSNSAHQPIIEKAENVHVIGKVVEVRIKK